MKNSNTAKMDRRQFLGKTFAGLTLLGIGEIGLKHLANSAVATFGVGEGSPRRNRTSIYSVNNRPIEQWPTIMADNILENFGFNLGYPKDLLWALDRAKAAGCQEIRAQPGAWSNEEIFGSSNAYRNLSRSLLQALKERDMRPRLVGAYGPPWKIAAKLRLLTTCNAGCATLHVDGDLSGFVAMRSFLGLDVGGPIHPSQGKRYLGNWSYYGTLILAVNVSRKQITLAAPLVASLPAGTPLALNELMYPFPLQPNPEDPGVMAYCNYLRELARQIELDNGSGSIEIWNEPPWPDDKWLTPKRFFSGTPPSLMSSASHDFAVYPAIFANLSKNWPFKNVRLCNAATNKTATGDWLFLKAGSWARLKNPTSNLMSQAQAQLFTESFHPYGPFPESQCWYPTAGETFPYQIVQGGNHSANLPLAVASQDRFINQFGYSISLEITETGLNSRDDFIQAIFMLRQYLAYQSLGFGTIDFFSLEENSHYRVLDSTTHTERLSLKVLSRLIDMVKPLAFGLPAELKALPIVSSYNGKWPLMMVPILGNGQFLLALYQRNYLESGKSWSDESGQSGYVQASAAKVVLRVPDGIAYQDSHNLFSQKALKISILSDGRLSISDLRDHPVFMRFTISRA